MIYCICMYVTMADNCLHWIDGFSLCPFSNLWMFGSHNYTTSIKFHWIQAHLNKSSLILLDDGFHISHLSHVRSWTGSRLHRRGAWTPVGSQRRDRWKARVPCRRSWPSRETPVAVTAASQTLAGPASIWASPCVYSALVFTGKVFVFYWANSVLGSYHTDGRWKWQQKQVLQ